MSTTPLHQRAGGKQLVQFVTKRQTSAIIVATLAAEGMKPQRWTPMNRSVAHCVIQKGFWGQGTTPNPFGLEIVMESSMRWE
jgi:hypothetical protein